ncbi:MAG: hypothetical protein AAGA54_14375 [Myxococcota bacterium]
MSRFSVQIALSLLFGASMAAGCDLATEETDETGTSASDSGVTTEFEPEDDDDVEPDCDPATFASTCSAGRLIECVDGMVRNADCGERFSCELGSDGAACVWRIGEPCDTEYAECEEPGGVLSCDVDDGVWRFDPCPFGGGCDQGVCFGPDDVACDETFVSRCDGESIVRCMIPGFEQVQACDEGFTCRTTASGKGSCLPLEAEPCEDETVRTCLDDQTLAGCLDGWTYSGACEEGQRCFEALTAQCADETANPCDPTVDAPRCEDGTAYNCRDAGFETVESCAGDQSCALDDTCFGECGEAAACIPTEGTPCEEPLDLFCQDDAIALCFAGTVAFESEPCGCTETEDGPMCTDP